MIAEIENNSSLCCFFTTDELILCNQYFNIKTNLKGDNKMSERENSEKWSLFRMIILAYPEVNIFSGQAKRTTALGPIMVATAANKLWRWRVDVIDENNFRGPKDSNGLPDHALLQRENPATVVGFYCGLTSTIERVWELAKFYHKEEVFNIAGGWHAHYCPEETLKHNIDVVVHGDGEQAIQLILYALENKGFLNHIQGISFIEDNVFKTNGRKIEILDLDELPYPNFGLLRFAKMKVYPISRIRGCSQRCEFCSVRGKPRWACAKHLFDTVQWLVETRKAKKFFIVDDRSEEDLRGTIRFFNMIANKYGSRLHFTVQIRLEAAKNAEFLKAMKRAGVRVVCVGVESPIDEDLKAMGKGYTSDNMLTWIKTLRRYFWVHAMFIVGYPSKTPGVNISPKKIVRCFRRFIRRSRCDSVQVMLPVPIVGTGLRKRLKYQGKLFPIDVVPWSMCDGGYVCFKPDNISVRELQAIPLKLMSRFYNPWSIIGILFKTITFPCHYIIMGWQHWLRGWDRDITKFGGHLLVRRRKRKQKAKEFLKRAEKC